MAVPPELKKQWNACPAGESRGARVKQSSSVGKVAESRVREGPAKGANARFM